MSETLSATDADALVATRVDELFATTDPSDEVGFWGRQFDLGLAWVQFPEGRGGLGLAPEHQRTVNDEIVRRGGSIWNRRRNILAIGMGAATIVTHGTPAQQDRYLRPLFTCEEIWCQLFSEPGAGSDLAGLATTAVLDGDTWIVNGQKVWTTLGHEARFGMLVARHDPDEVKHRGLTYFVLDMQAEGVEVRPLHQITGEAEFNEVWMTDVRIPDGDRLGDVGAGWRVAMTTLMNERVAIGGQPQPRGSGVIGTAVRTVRGAAGDDPVRDAELARLFAQAEALRLTTHRAAQAAAMGNPGPEGSTAKLRWADLNKEISTFAMSVLGDEGLTYPHGYARVVPERDDDPYLDPHKAFLRSRANSIEGGTSEVMRNILAERVLGLPGEPRTDKSLPWRDVPRD